MMAGMAGRSKGLVKVSGAKYSGMNRENEIIQETFNSEEAEASLLVHCY